MTTKNNTPAGCDPARGCDCKKPCSACECSESGPKTQTITAGPHRVGRRHQVTFRLELHAGTPSAIVAEWAPDVPEPGEVAVRQYRRARGRFLAEVERAIGGPVICLEAPQ